MFLDSVALFCFAGGAASRGVAGIDPRDPAAPIDALRAYLKANPTAVNTAGRSRRMPLLIAVQQGHLDIVKVLLQAVAQVDPEVAPAITG
jgi:hypothetical protein